jgi:hypothetical protein
MRLGSVTWVLNRRKNTSLIAAQVKFLIIIYKIGQPKQRYNGKIASKKYSGRCVIMYFKICGKRYSRNELIHRYSGYWLRVVCMCVSKQIWIAPRSSLGKHKICKVQTDGQTITDGLLFIDFRLEYNA